MLESKIQNEVEAEWETLTNNKPLDHSLGKERKMKRVCKKCGMEKEIEEFVTKWSCKQCVKLARARYDRFQSENLTDVYLKKLIKSNKYRMKTRDVTIPPEIIELKRGQLTMHRLINKCRKDLNSRNSKK